jgi:hypothetical protein
MLPNGARTLAKILIRPMLKRNVRPLCLQFMPVVNKKMST